jgi:Domain of unknown function (DUF4157)
MERVRRKPKEEPVPDRERYERAFGADFADVRVHRDSPRAHGVRALTEIRDVHLAPGVEPEDRLIAHELAHVVQQRRAEAPAPALAAELDADVAADAVVGGGTASPRAAFSGAQAYEAWEHRALGDALGGADRKIVLPNGIELTYGQIVALSGDFYRSPEALLAAPRQELEHILAVMDRERAEAAASPTHAPTPDQVNANNADYELATTGHDRVGSAVAPLDGASAEHTESGAPGPQASFLDLASSNEAHFSPENIRANWVPQHQLALDLARKAWQAGRDGAQYETQAWLTAAFADHYLTDAFASGHLISGAAGRTMCQAFYDANASAIADACYECATAEGLPDDDAALVVSGLQAFLSSRAASLLLKTVHDYYNREGIEVVNKAGQVWLTMGDAHLGYSPQTAAIAQQASLASRTAVQDVLDTGATTRAEAALDLIPDQARVAGGGLQPIAAFSTDLAVWEPVLRRSLNRAPADNDLYQMVKGNIGPMASLKARQGERAVGEAAEGVWHDITSVPDDLARWFAGLQREIERQYGVPF